jgi:nitrogen-specific signal transduction histidine kinase
VPMALWVGSAFVQLVETRCYKMSRADGPLIKVKMETKNINRLGMQPFFTTMPAHEGTGLGLSLSYDIMVKGHGGNISVGSKEGIGAEFIIYLPIN